MPPLCTSDSVTSEYKPRSEEQQNPLGSNMMAFTSPEDLMKILPKMMSNLSRIAGGGAISNSTTVKRSMKEYEEIGIKVGIRFCKQKVWPGTYNVVEIIHTTRDADDIMSVLV